MNRAPYPTADDERTLLLGYLDYYRDAITAKCEGLAPEQLAARPAAPSVLSLLGLVRHLCEMERACGWWPLGDEPRLDWVWGSYEDDAEHDIECTATDVDESFAVWRRERARTDEALAQRLDLDEVRPVNGRTVRWNVNKLLHEYARHAGHADLLREQLDGATGE